MFCKMTKYMLIVFHDRFLMMCGMDRSNIIYFNYIYISVMYKIIKNKLV